MFTQVLIPLDGSATAETILPLAGHWVEALKLPVELLAVINLRELLTSSEKARRFDKLIESETNASAAYLKKIAARFPAAQVKCAVEQGVAEESIIAHADTFPGTLIAMATHGRSGIDRWLMGSVAEKVLRGTKAPLLLTRARPVANRQAAASIERVIVPLDGSELAEKVLPMTGELAARLKLGVLLLRVYQMPSPLYPGGHGFHSVQVFEDAAAQERDNLAYLEKHAEALRQSGIEVSTSVREGFGGDEIIALARDTPNSLIAMSSHGGSGPGRWLLGSVAESVARHAVCPVLVYRSS